MPLFSKTSVFQILFALPSVRSSENIVTKSETFVEKCMRCLDLGVGFVGFCGFFFSLLVPKLFL